MTLACVATFWEKKVFGDWWLSREIFESMGDFIGCYTPSKKEVFSYTRIHSLCVIDVVIARRHAL